MINTADTTRLSYSNREAVSIAVSQLLYPTDNVSWKANSVIIVTGTDFRLAVPIVSLVHFPINAPILVSNTPHLSEDILKEIRRLNPSGEKAPAQIIMAGAFDPSFKHHLYQLGYSTLHFDTMNPFIQSIHIAEWRKRLLPNMMPEMITHNTFLISVETPTESLPAFGFSAHMGTPFLYTYRDHLPELTRTFLQTENHRNITIVGSTKTVAYKIEEECRQIVKGTVERFDGATVSDIAVDLSRNKSKATEMGWGRNTPGKGDAFTFFPADWGYALSSAPLSHLGKHTPLLPLSSVNLPAVYRDYLDYLRPRGPHPEPPFMHAFLLGDIQQIPFETQVEIEEHITFEETIAHE